MCMHVRSDKSYTCTYACTPSNAMQSMGDACYKICLPVLPEVQFPLAEGKKNICWHSVLYYSGRSRILKRFLCALDCYTWQSVVRKASEARLYTREVWGHSPQGNFSISDLLGSFLMLFWGKIARVRWPTANLVIVFEVFKHLQNLKVWLHFAPERLQSSREVWRKKKKEILASYCTRSVVALWSWEIQILTVCHCIHSYLLWYSTMVSVGHSVRGYVCTDLY